jgi:DnaJ-class molecular chaperone
MIKSEGWSFEAWRVCTQCKGTGEEPKKPPKAGVSYWRSASRCTKCDGQKRETRTFTFVQLAAELKSVAF